MTKTLCKHALVALLICLAACANAMDIKSIGNVLVMSGPVVDGDLSVVQSQLDANPTISTVILRNSIGGHAATGYSVGELFRSKGFTTVASGYCVSACSRMFLGGVIRQFANSSDQELNYIGFHGHYAVNGSLMRESVDQRGLLEWIVRYSDGKASRDLIKQWIYLPRNTDIFAFFHPATPFDDKKTVRNCERYTRSNGAPLRCPGVDADAITQGIITTTDRFDVSNFKL